MQEFPILTVLVVLSVIIGIINPTFFSVENFLDLLKSNLVLAIMAMGMLMVMLTGGIDVACSSIVGYDFCREFAYPLYFKYFRNRCAFMRLRTRARPYQRTARRKDKNSADSRYTRNDEHHNGYKSLHNERELDYRHTAKFY